MRYFAILVTFTIMVAGCGGNSEALRVNEVQTLDLEASSLGETLSYIEQYEGGGGRVIVPETHLAPIDYKSKLKIIPDKERIKVLADTEKEILPHLSPDVQERLQNVPKLIQAAEAYVANASQVLKTVETARRSEQELSQTQIKQIQSEIVEQGRQGLEIIELVIEVAEARAHALFGDNEDAVVAEVNRVTESLMEDAQGRAVIFNVQAFGAFLSEEIDFAAARAREDAEIAEEQGTAKFRMWAQLRGEERWVSVRPYFDAGSFEGQKAPRVALTMNADQQERLKDGFNIATKAARLIRDSRDEESSLRRELAALWKTLRSELEDLGDLPTDEILQDVSDTLVKAIDLAVEPNNVATEEEKTALMALRTFITTDVKADLNKLREISEGLEATSPAEFISKYIKFTQDLEPALNLVSEYLKKIDENVQRLEVLKKVLARMNTGENRALLETLLEKVLPETTRKLKEVLQYAGLPTKIRGLLAGGQPINMANGLETYRERPPVRAVHLDDIVPGMIDLNRTSADRGDELTVKAELFTTDENGKEDVLQWDEQSFRIDRYGVSSDFSSHLIFVDRRGSGLATDPDTDYDPAPSASWNLRYRVRPDVNADTLTQLYCFLDPGFGINTAAMDFEDENFQIGVGGHVTLFDNLLIFGYGYNLQAETDHDYFYLGIGVLEALDTVGSLFGAASGSLDRYGGRR